MSYVIYMSSVRMRPSLSSHPECVVCGGTINYTHIVQNVFYVIDIYTRAFCENDFY